MELGLPTGVRDYGPEAAARLLEVAGRLLEGFASHGYRRVVVPSIERTAAVGRGLGAEAQARLFQAVEPGTGEVVAVCPDHTAQVARMWAASLHALPPPVRVAYAGPVLRAREEVAGRPREAFQAGVECLGAAGPLTDAEVVALCARSLSAVGIEDAVVDLGHAGFVTAILDAAEVSPEDRARLRTRLGHKDAPSVEAVVRDLPRAGAAARKARASLPELAGLYGQDTLDRARRLARRAGVGAEAVSEVEALLHALEALSLPVRLTVDLGEVRGFGYYTGLTLHAYVAGAGTEVATGGRYDDLLGRYGRPAGAVGLAVDLTALLGAVGPGEAAPEGVLLVAGAVAPGAVLAQAARLREAGLRVHVVPGKLSGPEASAQARAHGLAWVHLPERGGGWREVDAATGRVRRRLPRPD